MKVSATLLLSIILALSNSIEGGRRNLQDQGSCVCQNPTLDITIYGSQNVALPTGCKIVSISLSKNTYNGTTVPCNPNPLSPVRGLHIIVVGGAGASCNIREQ